MTDLPDWWELKTACIDNCGGQAVAFKTLESVKSVMQVIRMRIKGDNIYMRKRTKGNNNALVPYGCTLATSAQDGIYVPGKSP